MEVRLSELKQNLIPVHLFVKWFWMQHANYFIRSNIKIEFFPDKAKITSPGGIFNASMDDIMNGVQTYRNPRLVHV